MRAIELVVLYGIICMMQYSDANKYAVPALTKIAAWWISAACLFELIAIPIAWRKLNLAYYFAVFYESGGGAGGLILIFCGLVSLLLLISVVALLIVSRRGTVVAFWTLTTILLLIQVLITPGEGGSLYNYHREGWSAFMFQRIPLIMYVPPLLLMLTDFGNLLLKKRRVVRYKE